MSNPTSQFLPPFPPWYPYICSLCLRLYFCFANKVICTVFLDFTYMHSYTIFCSSDLLHSVWQILGPSASLQMFQFHSFLWLSNIPVCVCVCVCVCTILLLIFLCSANLFLTAPRAWGLNTSKTAHFNQHAQQKPAAPFTASNLINIYCAVVNPNMDSPGQLGLALGVFRLWAQVWVQVLTLPPNLLSYRQVWTMFPDTLPVCKNGDDISPMDFPNRKGWKREKVISPEHHMKDLLHI